MRRRSDTLPVCSSPVRALRTCRRDRYVPHLVLYISMSSEDNQSQRGVVLSADPHNVNPRGRLVQCAAKRSRSPSAHLAQRQLAPKRVPASSAFSSESALDIDIHLFLQRREASVRPCERCLLEEPVLLPVLHPRSASGDVSLPHSFLLPPRPRGSAWKLGFPFRSVPTIWRGAVYSLHLLSSSLLPRVRHRARKLDAHPTRHQHVVDALDLVPANEISSPSSSLLHAAS
ncbi:hypothetical protein B0H13DRAFT_855300 [Mycena leptocephala]|nr:hypothetical protein B0H13DRAFT_855300 [Mycena leptocephala]